MESAQAGDLVTPALGDCFAVALAQTLGSMLITTDRSELQKIADKKECAILFLR